MRLIEEAVVVPPPGGRRDRGRIPAAVLDAAGRVVPEAVCATEKASAARFVPAPEVAVPRARLAGTWLFAGLASHHFGHQITRCLGRLSGLAALREPPAGLLYLPLDRRALAPAAAAGLRGLLAGLGLRLPVHVAAVPTAVERLAVGPDLFGEATGGRADPAFVAWARRTFLPQGLAPEPGRRLYLTRSALGPRAGRMLCEEVLERNLARAGYEILAPETLPLPDQIAACARAETILATDGSALHLAALARQHGQRIGVIARRAERPALLLAHLDSFGAGLADSVLHVFDRLAAEWWPPERADNLSLAEIDLAGLAADLAAAGFVAAVRGWDVPSAADLAAARALAAGPGGRLLSAAERAAFLRTRRTVPRTAREEPVDDAPAPSAPAPAGSRGEDGDPPGGGLRYLRVLKALHERLRPEWYLEIGTFKGRSLRLAAGSYVAIDPEFRLAEAPPLRGREMIFFRGTSDDFFASATARALKGRVGLAFLDGLHHYEVLLRDVAHVEALMARGGMVVLHDCLPPTAESAGREHRPHRDWAGDVWKTLLILKRERPDLAIDVLDSPPTGLVVLRRFSPARGRALLAREAALRAEWDGITLDGLPGGLAGFRAGLGVKDARAFLAALDG